MKKHIRYNFSFYIHKKLNLYNTYEMKNIIYYTNISLLSETNRKLLLLSSIMK